MAPKQPFFATSVEISLPVLITLVAVCAGLVAYSHANQHQGPSAGPPPPAGTTAPPAVVTADQSPDKPKRKLVRSNSTEASYRIQEETTKRTSSEFTRRGQLWSKHASWHIPGAPRLSDRSTHYLISGQGLEYVRAVLRKFDVDPITGFLPSEDPLQRLPYARYHLWEDLGDDLPKLLGARLGQARFPLEQLPVLSTDKLVTDADLKRAHLLLSLFAHAYVWGGTSPIDSIPAGIAKPLWEVSERLGIPPILGHPSIVLYNWRRLDSNGEICMENLSTLNNFFDGRDESWFYLITVEIEARGAVAIVPMMLALDAAMRFQEEGKVSGVKANFWGDCEGDFSQPYLSASQDADEDDGHAIPVNEALAGELSAARVCVFVTAQLELAAKAVKGMVESMDAMREGCHPLIFYQRVRPFLSGWKHNPTVPNGVIYEGVSEERQQFYGGSAAQSALLPFLDIMLGVEHDSVRSRDFLLAMRDYMFKPHRDFLAYLETTNGLRPFVLEQVAWLDREGGGGVRERREMLIKLREAYDTNVMWLKKFRDSHMSIVQEYIIVQQRNGTKAGALEGSAGGKGTGGTELLGFLRPIRNAVAEKVIKREARSGSITEDDLNAQQSSEYIKSQGRTEDTDIFRGEVRE